MEKGKYEYFNRYQTWNDPDPRREWGTVIPITVIQAGPCTVTQVKSVESDGYNAVQLGYGEGKNLSNAVAGPRQGRWCHTPNNSRGSPGAAR